MKPLARLQSRMNARNHPSDAIVAGATKRRRAAVSLRNDGDCAIPAQSGVALAPASPTAINPVSERTLSSSNRQEAA